MFSRLKIWYFFDQGEIEAEKKDLISFKASHLSTFAYEIRFSCSFASFPLFALRSGPLKTTLTFLRWVARPPVLLGSWEVAQPCRSRGDRRAELAQVPLRALPGRHPQLLPCRPLRRIPLRLPPTGRDPAPGSTRMPFPNAWGRTPRHSFPNPLFPAAWSGWHYGKADHEHRQPNLQGVGGRRDCRAH